MTEPTTHPNDPGPPPTLAEAMRNLVDKTNDAAGEMIHGHRWPQVKAELKASVERRAQLEADTAKREARAAAVRAFVLIVLTAYAILLGPALIVWAWRAAL